VIEKEITPDLSSNYPKTQSYAIVSMLRALATWEKDHDKILASENSELERVLRKSTNLIRRVKLARKTQNLLKRIDAALASGGGSDGKSLEVRNSLLRKLLDDLLIVVDSDPGWDSSVGLQNLRREVQSFLKKRIKSEMKLSVPRKMAEFSKGSK
jgi:hypothetical protein